MVNLDEIRDRCREISEDIERLFIETGYKEFGQICIVGRGESVESYTLFETLTKYLQELDMASIYIDQACAAEIEQGMVRKAEDGSFIFMGRELQAGDIVQVFDDVEQYWKIYMLEDRFEPGNHCLVLKGRPDLDLDGLSIRHAVTPYS